MQFETVATHRHALPRGGRDFAFLLHGFHYLSDLGVMAIILPHGVLFRGGAEEGFLKELG